MRMSATQPLRRRAERSASEHEHVLVRRGERSGVSIAIGVHSTALGPALGGCRMWRYPSAADAVRDALRLSRAMTFKAAAAGLVVGGGKGVIRVEPGEATPTGERREAMLLDFADAVESLGGRYVTAEDVGTSADDMVTIARRTAHVVGLPAELGGSGDPSPFTALGVVGAIRACLERRFGTPDAAGRSIAVVGCGRVGAALAHQLASAGAELLLADLDPAKRALADELPGATWVEPDAALLAAVDVLAPCALGGVIDARNVDALRCAIVCGSANNQLASEELADALAARGILYAPDFIVNAGGLINVALELEGYDRERALAGARGIEDVMRRILTTAEAAGTTPLAAAYELACRRLERPAA